MPSPAHQLADMKLGGPGEIERYVRERRAQGVAWRVIARDLYTEHNVDVTHETLRTWVPDLEERVS